MGSAAKSHRRRTAAPNSRLRGLHTPRAAQRPGERIAAPVSTRTRVDGDVRGHRKLALGCGRNWGGLQGRAMAA